MWEQRIMRRLSHGQNKSANKEESIMEEKIVFCRGGGCTAKLGAGVLARVLEKLPKYVQREIKSCE